jgi:hypothetical protein
LSYVSLRAHDADVEKPRVVVLDGNMNQRRTREVLRVAVGGRVRPPS